jgi:glucosamine--fructose-6-phosphate aminotransferase (isomerizing)
MCGIVGYVGRQSTAGQIVIDGLSRLEYRGYDSAGIALWRPEGRIDVVRSIGATAELSATVTSDGVDLGGHVAIGHTRWATHGPPSVRNAHPHLSWGGRLALVHNGIIENWSELRRRLEPTGVGWRSDTDTEVLSSWIEHVWSSHPGSDLLEAVREALGDVMGAYAILALDVESGTVVAARRSSPMAVGLGDGEVVIASDAVPIVRHTRDIVYLDDGDLARISLDPAGRADVRFSNLLSKVVTPRVERVEIEAGTIELAGYDTFMLKEIHEQPNTVHDALRGRLSPGEDSIVLGGLDPVLSHFLRANRIRIVACGTSWHAGLIGKHIIESLTRIPVEVDYASEFRYRDPIVGLGDVVIAISQSGETADTYAALELAEQRGATPFGIVNVVGSSISRLAAGGIYTRSGIEIGVASTKAFTGQITCLALLALRLAHRLGTLDEEQHSELKCELASIPEKIATVLEASEDILGVADAYSDSRYRSFLYLGRGINFPVALEGALKLKEVSYVHAEAYPAGEMKHGPIALIDENCPSVFLVPGDSHYEKTISNIQEIRARKGPIIAIATHGNEDIELLADHTIRVPATHELLSPLVTAVPLQLLAYRIASNRGCNIDKPRNLAKSVTVE